MAISPSFRRKMIKFQHCYCIHVTLTMSVITNSNIIQSYDLSAKVNEYANHVIDPIDIWWDFSLGNKKYAEQLADKEAIRFCKSFFTLSKYCVKEENGREKRKSILRMNNY